MVLLASDYDKSKYFKGTDLDREKKFRIKDTTEEVLTDSAGKTEKRLCLWFTNDPRGRILNKTDLRTMKGAFGDPVDGWKNKVIAMFPVMAGNGKPGLRIRILPPKQVAAAVAPQQPANSGNGAAAAVPAAAPVVTAAPPTTTTVVEDPELAPESLHDEMDDEVTY